jgi:AcrR family transcriptional regulator
VTIQPKRIRRTAEDARRQILDAADARLARTGPAGIRLQDVAADVGISHPVILHHFGSREGLIRALTKRAVSEFQDKLLRAIDGGEHTESVLGDVFNTMRHGLAQRLAWLVLTGATEEPGGEDTALQQIVRTVHEHRLVGAPPGTVVDPLDTSLTVYLVAVAAFGDAIFGPQLRRGAGLANGGEGASAFETWFAALISNHLN